MERFYKKVILDHFQKNRQMLFVMGPRQVGKTTTAMKLKEDWERLLYYNCDQRKLRREITRVDPGLGEVLRLGSEELSIPLIVFDELHKYRFWKQFLKGLYDTYPAMAKILVTGSARLDTYQRGADSLMGRFFRLRMHPFTVRELSEPNVVPVGVRPEPCALDQEQYEALLRYGGFPDPLFRADEDYHQHWTDLRNEQLFRGDLSDLSKVREVGQLEMLSEFLRDSVGSQTSYTSLAKKIGVTHVTVRRWITWLRALYFCFEVRPWAGKLSRTLIKEPKYYLVDWSTLQNKGAQVENFVASHLLKAVEFWSDLGKGKFRLHYVRDQKKREVDFLITRGDKPWLLVEVKSNNSHSLSPSLVHFQKQLGAAYALQVVFGMKHSMRPCFIDSEPRIVPMSSFLSQLV